ncbi:hypothetical protein YC2023_114226 [Brassica napus]
MKKPGSKRELIGDLFSVDILYYVSKIRKVCLVWWLRYCLTSFQSGFDPLESHPSRIKLCRLERITFLFVK